MKPSLALLALRSKLSLLLLLGQQLLLLLLLLLLLDRPVDVELGEARLPCFGDLVLNEADLLLTLVQELLLFRTEFQWLQALLNIGHGVTTSYGGSCVRPVHGSHDRWFTQQFQNIYSFHP